MHDPHIRSFCTILIQSVSQSVSQLDLAVAAAAATATATAAAIAAVAFRSNCGAWFKHSTLTYELMKV